MINFIYLKKNSYLFLRQIVLKFLYKFNYKLSKTVNEKKLLNFLYTLKPYRTNNALIRLGEDNDGGYLIPNDLKGITGCFTAGVGDKVKFEHDLAEMGIECFMADYSVAEPPISHKKFKFLKKFINNEYMNNSININDFINKNKKLPGDYILKIDIEGDEYSVLTNILDANLQKMRIIIFEIHEFTDILNSKGFVLISNLFKKLQKNHTIVHIHPNNNSPSIKFSNKLELFDCMEITMLRNNRILHKEPESKFPNKLDHKLNSIYESELPKCFYKKIDEI